MFLQRLTPKSLKRNRRAVSISRRNISYSLNNNSEQSFLKSHGSSPKILPSINKILSNKIIDGDIAQAQKQPEMIKQHKHQQSFVKDVKKHIIPIYRIDQSRHKQYIDIKQHNEIAFKKDFDIKDYQRNLGDSNLNSVRVLKKNFDKLNDILDGKRIIHLYTLRWKPLASRIRSYAPEYLINKLKYVTKN